MIDDRGYQFDNLVSVSRYAKWWLTKASPYIKHISLRVSSCDNTIMASVARSFPPPTAAPLALYTPGLTGIDSALPTHSTAFGWALQRVLSLTTTASTIGFKWLSLDNLSRRPLDLPATPASNYCLQPTTIITTGNFSLAISVIPAFVFLVSLLFGAGVVHFGRRRGSSISPFTVSRPKVKYAKSLPKSLYTDSPTLFHRDASVLSIASYIPRLSLLWICALSFLLRGLAFLFRLIHMEKLLDMVEHNAADHKAAVRQFPPFLAVVLLADLV